MNALRRLSLSLLAAAALLVAGLARAGDDYPAKIVAADVSDSPLPAGARFEVLVDVEIEAGYHCYGLAEKSGLPPKFAAPKEGWPAGLVAGEVTETPAPETEEFGGEKVLVHQGKVRFALPFTVAADAKPGLREIQGALQVQVCDAKSCLPPEKLPFTAKFWVAEPSTVRVTRTEFIPATAPAGGDAVIEIELSIAKGWHVYGQKQEMEKPPKFRWQLPEGWTASGGLVEVTPPHDAKLYGLDDIYSVHEGRLVLRQSFKVPAGSKPGPAEVKGFGTWQRCDDSGCSDDKDVPVAATVTIGAAGAPAASPQEPPKPPPAPKVEEDPKASPAPPPDAAPVAPKPEQSLGSVLLSGIGWGFITILTPCVFPLLPVTVSYFSKQKGPALPRSLVYAAGIVFTITVIGLIFKSSLDLMSRGSIFNLFVGLLFIVLALSLFGLFELQLPSALIDQSQSKARSGGLVGPFFMAVTLALTSFSCSVPFLAIMFSRFDEGHYVQSVMGLLAYGVTLALPFFLCSLFPSLMKALPSSGGWLNAVKVTMGFVEFGLAFKFLRTVALNMDSEVLSRSLVLAIWVACALGAAVYLLGYITLPHDTKTESIGVVRLLFALMFLAVAAYLVPGTFGRPLSPALDGFLQTDEADLWVASAPGQAAGPAEEIAWGLNDWDGALARAAEKDRPVLFDFTGVG